MAEALVERHTAEGNLSWRARLSREEIAELLRFEDWHSWSSIAFNWVVVFASMALVAWWPHGPTRVLPIVVALFLIGARQLGLAVLMHEAAHRSLFAKRSVNDWAGQWLCAYPVWSDTHVYRAYHLQHHAHTGTPRDPDLGLVTPFPITRASLRRKVIRDLTGRTGVKFARAAFARSLARWSEPEGRRATIGVLVTNALLLGALAALGHGWLYLLWVGAWLTTNTLLTRIRSIAEHALTPNADDPLGNTRTTLLSWWERLLIGPNRVNYHLEHHLLMTVPHYKLPRMHALLLERGLLGSACVERGGYAAILRRAASKPSA
ncbi:MAG TPA: fatty acid desaturase family protein [Myxococcota bacterium]|jgi:fatty acid desaturase